jgi:hypothetical protein
MPLRSRGVLTPLEECRECGARGVREKMSARVGLSAEQSARVQEILAGRQGEMEKAWAEVHANLRRAMQEATAEIETVLDSAQIDRLRAWLAERHRPTSRHPPGQEH